MASMMELYRNELLGLRSSCENTGQVVVRISMNYLVLPLLG